MGRFRTSRDAKGPADLKPVTRTAASVTQGRIPPRSGRHLKHCHTLKSSRQIVRIDRREWEERVADALRVVEEHRYRRVNALHTALQNIQKLLRAAQTREYELRETSSALERTSTYLQTLMDSMPDVLVATSLDGRVTEANHALQSLTGRPRAALVDVSFGSLFTDPPAAMAAVETIVREGALSDFELTLPLPSDAVVALLLNATVLTDPEGAATGVLINARDITDLKEAQESLRHYATELARANEDLEEFASVASHELDEPLRQVQQYAGRLVDRFAGDADPEAARELAYLRDQTEHMRSLVGNVLAYAKAGAEEAVLEQVDGEEVLAQVHANLRGALEEGAVLTQDPLPTVLIDREHLLRVLQNLVGNAVKYRPPTRDLVHVHVSAERTEATAVTLPEGARRPGWMISVRDDGLGVDPAYVDEIFKMFVRLHSVADYPGTGMGLAISWKVIRRRGGHIWVESEVGEGSTFRFTIPDQS